MTSGVRGDLIQWARQEQELTMRWVRDHGGPSLGYQSEVEHGKKDEVRSAILQTWTDLLGVTGAFARGLIPRYADDPTGCRGLAADLAPLPPEDLARLAGLNPLERGREVLRIITLRSKQLPRVVLAHVLGLTLKSMDAMLLGSIPIGRELVPAIAALTTLPETYLRSGDAPAAGELRLDRNLQAAISEALDDGTTQRDLAELIQLHGFLPLIRQACDHGMSPEQATRRLMVL